MRNTAVTLAVTTPSPNRIAPSEASRRLGVKASDKGIHDVAVGSARAFDAPWTLP